MATYKRGTRFGILSFARITSNTTVSQLTATPELTPDNITEIKNKLLYRKDCSSVHLITGDPFKYYLPLTSDNFDVDITGFDIVVLDQNFNQISSSIGTVSSGSYEDQNYYYIELTAPPINEYRCVIAIIDQNDSDRIYYLSNYIDFELASEKENYPFFKWRNSYNNFDHFWEGILNDVPTFFNQIRLDVNKKDANYEYEIEQHKESITGDIIDIINDHDKYITIETYDFTEEMHDGFSVLTGSDTLYINDVSYSKKSGYESETPSLINTTKGNIDLFVDDFATANKAAV
jgi:hypothetical protein